MGDFNHYQKGAAQNFHFPRTGLCQGDEHINCYVASFFVIKRFGFLSSSSWLALAQKAEHSFH